MKPAVGNGGSYLSGSVEWIIPHFEALLRNNTRVGLLYCSRMKLEGGYCFLIKAYSTGAFCECVYPFIVHSIFCISRPREHITTPAHISVFHSPSPNILYFLAFSCEFHNAAFHSAILSSLPFERT